MTSCTHLHFKARASIDSGAILEISDPKKVFYISKDQIATVNLSRLERTFSPMLLPSILANLVEEELSLGVLKINDMYQKAIEHYTETLAIAYEKDLTVRRRVDRIPSSEILEKMDIDVPFDIDFKLRMLINSIKNFLEMEGLFETSVEELAQKHLQLIEDYKAMQSSKHCHLWLVDVDKKETTRMNQTKVILRERSRVLMEDCDYFEKAKESSEKQREELKQLFKIFQTIFPKETIELDGRSIKNYLKQNI